MHTTWESMATASGVAWLASGFSNIIPRPSGLIRWLHEISPVVLQYLLALFSFLTFHLFGIHFHPSCSSHHTSSITILYRSAYTFFAGVGVCRRDSAFMYLIFECCLCLRVRARDHHVCLFYSR
ncbi:hypothetical protein BJX99DRAFT_37417 [Aspergillus californicus]